MHFPRAVHLLRRKRKPEVIARIELHGWRFVRNDLVANEDNTASVYVSGGRAVVAAQGNLSWPPERMDPWKVPNTSFWALADELEKRGLI
jgi:hypothetical protein